MMIKYEVFEDKVAEKRAERRNATFNEKIAASLANKTHDEVVQELFQGLTVILGVGDILMEKTLVL